jgi:threonine dehydrogenase-like Zn-dependent dehydrogenase
MPTTRSVQTAVPGAIEVTQTGRPVPGPADVLLRVRACGICGTDAAFIQLGGMPQGPSGQMTTIQLGHEPAGEIVETGTEVTGLKPGDRVVVNPQAAPSGIIGCGGAQGSMSEYLLIDNARAGRSLAVFPDTLPFEVAAFNEPMAAARYCVNRSQARGQGRRVRRRAHRARGAHLAECQDVDSTGPSPSYYGCKRGTTCRRSGHTPTCCGLADPVADTCRRQMTFQ